jgi:glycosyltransferase involved in cell wall biosynthesis
VRLLLVIRDLDIGGAQRQVINLANKLAARGHEVAILPFYPRGRLSHGVANHRVRIFDGAKRGRWDLWSPFIDLRRALSAFKPDCVYSFLSLASIFVGVHRLLEPHPRWLFGYRHSEMDIAKYAWQDGVMYRFEAWLSRNADCIIANSNAGALNAKRWGFRAERIRVVPNGIETDYFHPSPALRETTRQKWGMAAGTMLIGLVGRIDPMKDHMNFINAARALKKTHPHVRFACIGDGSREALEKLKDAAIHLDVGDTVLWLGAQSDMAGVYNALDVLCLPSAFGEGFPNVVGEAMACGVSCVVSDVGDSALVVGGLGQVVPPGDSTALAAALAAALDARCAKLALTCRERIENEFSMERLASRTEDAMLGVMGHDRA